jgi:nitroreductase
MELFETIRTRRSIREYQNKLVEDEKLMQVLEAARLAPTARNRQEFRLIVVRDKTLRQKLSVAAKGQPFVAQAPVVIATCGLSPEYLMSCGQPGDVIDGAIVIDHMTLAARSLGLGTCWIGAFYQEEVKKLLGVPDGAHVIQLLCLGYPDIEPTMPSRKSLDDLVCYDGWLD